MYRYFKKTGISHHISAWRSKGLYDESINPPSPPDDSIAPLLNYIGTI